ncbi:molybdenum cofactor guanylyltransferase [Paenibacillus sediminis]|uniref:Molybdopterin-guanine dinucleotide biosynthesis protein A n=1 Tax=Paenibacillus sediminis TaxID=664909 RepID=A0ABS4H3Y6_9BACL|nr:molybdenum cofactor guanylyltransferase [Paenibacillus sediminis]MBP1937247.1 molybdopterin-guanine dinucleotide biosynthesis protein A [Paenibacillus sediminis]
MLTGVILAGGRGAQMNGIHKSLLTIGSEKIIERQLRVLKSVCTEVIIVTDEPKAFLSIVGRDVRIITDFVQGRGPLGGMHAALSLCTSNSLWVVDCGMPFICASAVKLMLSLGRLYRWDAIIPFIGGRHEMLHGIYLKSCLSAVNVLLDQGITELKHLKELLNVYTVTETVFLENGISSAFTRKINDLGSYLEVEKMLSERG